MLIESNAETNHIFKFFKELQGKQPFSLKFQR